MQPGRTRIAHFVDSFQVGGTELNAIRTLEGLVERNMEVDVFHLRDEGPLKARYLALGIPMHHIPIAGLASAQTARRAVALGTMLRRRRIQVVQTHDVYTNVFAAPVAKLAGCRVIASRRWWFEVPRAGLNTVNRWSYLFADLVLANSPSVAAMLERKERVPSRKIIVVPNFVDVSCRSDPSAPEKRAQLERWNIASEAFVIGMVGRLTRAKNYPLAIDAIARLPADCHLVIAGEGDMRAEITRRIEERGVRERVHLLGELESASEFQKFFDVSLLTSNTEGFPNVLLEAMRAARPVVATAVGGVPDLVTHGSTGLLVPDGDRDALVDALRTLRRDTALREHLGSHGYRLVAERFSRESAISSLVNAYASLGARGAP